MKSKTLALLSLLLLILSVACRDVTPADPADTPTRTPATAAATVEAVPSPTPTAEVQATDTPLPMPEATLESAVEGEEAGSGLPPATILNDDGGVVNLSGAVSYTNPFFTLGVAAPVVILEDQAGFVDRNEGFLMPIASQTLGQITSDFFVSPFTYNLSLPIVPQGTLRDVDQNDAADTGVQVFAVAYWTNTFGDPFLEARDLRGGGWSTAYASTRVSDDADTENEIVGGKLLIFAPDDQQGFPAGFGDDGFLFTADDPIVRVPKGYTIVDLDADPFTFDRSRDQTVDLIEPEGAALVDYSELSYTDAFNALIDQLKNEYAFTEYKGLDWEAIRAKLEPRFQQADAEADVERYREALRDLALSIPDGHVRGPFLVEQFRFAAGGGIGIAIRELDDGRVQVNFLAEDSPAAQSGVLPRAEILAINEVPIADHIGNTVLHGASSHSTAHSLLLDQMRFATRFPVGTPVQLTFVNPGTTAPQTVDLTASGEVASFNFWLQASERDGFELPVEYERLDNDVGYVRIFSFSDNHLLAVQIWERMIRTMKEAQVSSLIIDMRENLGGSGFLADQLAAYFFDEELVLGNVGYYDEDVQTFQFDSRTEKRFFLPADDLRFDKKVAVLVGPECASACEFFSYNMTLQDRAIIVGHYPTAGLGGTIDQVAMPEEESFTFTQGRAVDVNGNIHIEGIGVIPDVMVAVTEATLFSEGDPLLEAALTVLAGDIIDAGTLAIGESASGTVESATRLRYMASLDLGDVASFILRSETSGADLILAVYDDEGNFLAASDPGAVTGFENLELSADITFILEVSLADETGPADFTLSIIDES